ncbi:MAG: hypothetical protein IT184_18525 [Acidobacteria bacterium]|nr:hypothetical protein [Acidobacteriota bacterium]
MTTRSLRRVALSLGAVAIVALVLAAMALQDIYHQERDVRLEWNMVRIAFLVMLAFTFTAMTALWKDE